MRAIRFDRAHRRAALGAAALGVILGLGCGKNRVILNVDVLSFMDASQKSQPYDAPPLVPKSTQLDPIAVNLVEGYQDFGLAQEATLDVGLDYDNQTGQGVGTFQLYFSDDASQVYSTTPVSQFDVDLVPSTLTHGGVTLQLDQRLLDLFTSKHFFMGVGMTWTPQATDPLQGTCVISKIDVRMVSTLNVF